MMATPHELGHGQACSSQCFGTTPTIRLARACLGYTEHVWPNHHTTTTTAIERPLILPLGTVGVASNRWPCENIHICLIITLSLFYMSLGKKNTVRLARKHRNYIAHMWNSSPQPPWWFSQSFTFMNKPQVKILTEETQMSSLVPIL